MTKQSSAPRHRISRITLSLILAAGSLITSALATPPGGIVSAPVMARGAFADATDVKFKISGHGEHVIHVRNSADTIVQQIIFGPGGYFGWHSHPGPVIVLVKSGALSFYEADDPTCTPRTYVAGQVFVDSGQGHVHFARNLSATDNLEVWATYLDVPPGSSPRVDAPDPGNCSF